MPRIIEQSSPGLFIGNGSLRYFTKEDREVIQFLSESLVLRVLLHFLKEPLIP